MGEAMKEVAHGTRSRGRQHKRLTPAGQSPDQESAGGCPPFSPNFGARRLDPGRFVMHDASTAGVSYRRSKRGTAHMPIDRAAVEHVAALASLDLKPEEVGRLTEDLARIIAYVDTLSEVDTTGVSPTHTVGVSGAPLRKDVQQSGLSQEEALSEAPRTSAGGFAVPGFVEAG